MLAFHAAGTVELGSTEPGRIVGAAVVDRERLARELLTPEEMLKLVREAGSNAVEHEEGSRK